MSGQARRAMPPKRVRHPAGCSFASGCFPPRLATTQLPSATCVTTSHRLDFHPPDKTTSRTHPPRQSRGNSHRISCSNCSSGFGSIGSYAIGAHGRWNLSDELTLMGGFSYDEYSASGITVTNAPIFAGALVYDPVNFGRSRPFVEVGGGATPYEQVKYTRSYPAGESVGVGYGRGVDRSSSACSGGSAGSTASRRSTKPPSMGTSAETGWSPAAIPRPRADTTPIRPPSRTASTRSTSPASEDSTPISSAASSRPTSVWRSPTDSTPDRGRNGTSPASAPSPLTRSGIRPGSNGAVASATASPGEWSSTPSCLAPSAELPGPPCTAALDCDTCSEPTGYFSSSAISGAQPSGSSSSARRPKRR